MMSNSGTKMVLRNLNKNKGTDMTKTNKELNQEHERRELMRVRPKGPVYNFKPLEEVVNRWVRERLNNQYE